MSSPETQASATTTFKTNVPAVNQVRRILLTAGLPYELVDLVLNYAEYFARHTTKRVTHLRVQASSDPLNNAKWMYMVSDPIIQVQREDGSVVPPNIQDVKFRLRSSDQGWGGFSEGKNTYRNSYTWFEASILRESTPGSSPTWLSSLLDSPVNYTFDLGAPGSSPSAVSSSSSDSTSLPVTEYAEYSELLSPYKLRTKRWLVQMNAQASRHIRTHTVTWSRSTSFNTSGDGGLNEEEYDEKTGSGRGLGFVEALRAGDRIALVARALYPGWENNVYEAEIEVAYQT
ncbi:hypothetical protein NP233_g1367 [Leucocoprinus birnbaumii]|uniref:Uncharacterized protein n=1 Tax=Leucocoprinus birnbaumii TaxID=56174 RepID=A0AAD5W010_9AGAR|nr:hypothetical protein NP233_g1367 [Leucocoprinus birnbaumii]